MPIGWAHDLAECRAQMADSSERGGVRGCAAMHAVLTLWLLVALGCTGSIDGGGPGGDGGSGGGSDGDGPVPQECRAALVHYGVEHTDGKVSPGVEDPVTATLPIRGIGYRAQGAANPRETLYADCTLIRSLAEAAPLLSARGVVEVADLGVYNYRCIGGGAPPDCPNGISQHAFATAIDIAGVKTADGEFLSVNDDWVIDPNAEETCAAATEAGKDQFLHEMICALKEAKVWNIVLTPNYNADHRNHFHVDLTPESDLIERRDPATPRPAHH